MFISIRPLLFCSVLLLSLQATPARAETCTQVVQNIDQQHRKALNSLQPGSDDYLHALHAIEDDIFPALKRCPANAPLLVAMAELQLSLGQPPIARLYAQKALELAPDSWQAHNAAGSALNMQGNFLAGLHHLQRAGTLQPDNFALLVNLCSSYERNQQYAEAIDACSRVIDNGPAELRGTAYSLRARAHEARGEREQAVRDDKQAKESGFRSPTGVDKTN
ncbi:tetratricopeptide repeat protein [Sulfuriflexus sp.]|uniref:tetratricopeptide repeat protein n=1 Tax=Sulfuriflexus sp. TaxID=2015443 RepID=UPI0028CE356B|nr:tetratricopeptide repeat protein [Sulfuriflexus sp.]MDT8405348.1 tetratricopeptide repeat protein [Sulfuriflexus sp.]